MAELTREAWLESLLEADEDTVFMWVLAADGILDVAHEAKDHDLRIAAAGLLLVLLRRDQDLLQKMMLQLYGLDLN